MRKRKGKEKAPFISKRDKQCFFSIRNKFKPLAHRNFAKGNISMQDNGKQKRLRAVKIAQAINSIEGVPVPDETNESFSQWINGDITDE